MAQVIPQMKLMIDTSGAVKSIKDVDTGVKQLSSDLGGLNTNLKGTSDSVNNTAKSTESLKAQLRAMTLELQNLEPGTARFNELTTAAGQLKDQIADTNAAINATAGSAVENLAGAFGNTASIGIAGFQGITAAQALFGSESKNLEKILVKLQALMALSEAAKTLGGLGDTLTNIKAQFAAVTAESSLFNKATVAQAVATGQATTAQKIMNTVMKANPIFLIVGAITAAIAAFALLSGETESASEKTERLNKEQEKLNQTMAESAKRVDALNKSYANYRQEANLTGVLQVQRQLIDAEDRLTDILRTRPNDYKSIIAVQQQINSLNIKIAEDEKKARIEAFKEETTLMESRLQNISVEQQQITSSNKANTDAAQSRLSALFDEAEALRITLQTRQKNLVTQQDGIELQNLTLELENNIARARIDAANKIADLNQKIYETEIEAIRSISNASSESYQKAQENATEAINRRYDEQVAAADKELALIDKTSTRRIEAEKNYDVAVKNFAIEREKALATLQAEIRKSGIIRVETEINDIKRKLLTAQNLEAIVLAIQLHEKQKQLLNLQMEEELRVVGLTEEEKFKIRSDYALKTAELEKEFRSKGLEDSEQTVDKQKKSFKELFKEVGETWENDYAVILGRITDFTVNIGTQITDLLGQVFSQLNEQVMYSLEEDTRIRTELLSDELANRLITQEEYDRRVEELNDQRLQKERGLKRKQFNQDKALRITNAIMLGAQSVVSALTLPPPAGYIMAAINAGLAAAQIGIISSQKFTAARGGIVPGNGPSTIDSVNSVLAPGEAVINANSASMFPTLLSEINKAGGGVSLAPQPLQNMTSGSNNVFNQGQTTIRAYVVENELTGTQDRVRRMENSSAY